MLGALIEYAHGHGLKAEAGFKPKDVRWAIVFDDVGRFLNVIELGDTNQKRNRGRTFPVCPDLSQQEMVSGGVTKSHFLVDSAEVVALLSKNPDSPKVQAKHKYFVDLLGQATESMPTLELLSRALSDPSTLDEMRTELESQKVKPNDKVTFRIGGSFPVESNAWHGWWRNFRASLVDQKSSKRKKATSGASGAMRCLVTGELTEPLATHPKIEGLGDVGGLATGDVVIGFDKEAFRSYGLEQSTNAAVSEEAGMTYRAALNFLIRNKSRRLASTKVVHWYVKDIPPEDDPLPQLVDPPEIQERDAQRRAAQMLDSIQKGERPDLADNYYHALTLSGASGRVMVRDWMEGQFTQLVENINAWFDDLSIVHREGGRLAQDPKLMAVLGSMVRDLNEVPAPLETKMWRVAVRNESIPATALARAMVRTRSAVLQDQAPNHARMGLIKAYHIRKARREGDTDMEKQLKPYLNENHPHPAYHCGRLLAILAGLQKAALGADIGAGVVQRYFASASTTPALVLGRLTNLSQHHVAKLHRDAPGLADWYQGRIAGVWSCIKDIPPSTLKLEEQSLFALGYYQQLADLRTRKADITNSKEEKNNE